MQAGSERNVYPQSGGQGCVPGARLQGGGQEGFMVNMTGGSEADVEKQGGGAMRAETATNWENDGRQEG